MLRRALLLLAVTALPAVAQPGQGNQPGPRNPSAEPIHPDSYPAHIRRTPPSNPMIQRIWDEGMNRSQAMTLAQQLTDPVGQRLTASTDMERAQDWIAKTYESWGVTVRKERYGTWEGWKRGVAHVDLLAPRLRTLEAHPLAWSPGTGGRPVEGDVIAPPMTLTTPEAFDAWLPNVRGKIVLLSAPRLSCRSPQQWREFGTPEEIARINEAQTAVQREWGAVTTAAGGANRLWKKLQDNGAIAAFTFGFSNYPGIAKIFGSPNQGIPAFAIGCEDYGLLARLAQNSQGPRVRAYTDSERLGERPVFNVIAEIRGSEKPDEYVMLSAHFDSWSASSGATDNATGTITMLEALRILRQVYPRPKRTILVGHWSGEEQGLIGSRAYSEDHPEVVAGLQALWNQDNGTGRIVGMSAGPFPGAAARIEQYLGEIPNEITRWIRWGGTSGQATGGTDHASFVCHKAPAFSLGALSWDYGSTTWHTDRDTFDKIVESDIKNNATLVAMLAYLSSEDPQRMPRDVMDPLPPQGQQRTPGVWRDCTPATRQTPPPPSQ